MVSQFQTLLIALSIALTMTPCHALAHSALCSCFDEGDGTVTCEGGFSDGSSASGVRIFIRTPENKTLIRGRMNESGEFNFKKPTQTYKVVFDAGPGHQVTIPGDEIVD